MLHRLLHWIDASLRRKYIVGMSLGLLSTALMFLLLFATLYQESLRQERSRASGEVSRLLQTSLENAMLKQDLAGLQDIVSGLGRQDGVAAVMILNPDGEVRFASDTATIGDRHSVVSDPGCNSCHRDRSTAMPAATFFTDDDGRDLLRGVTPVRNRQACTGCHGSVEDNPVNGVLVVDYDAVAIRSEVRDRVLAMMSAGVVLLLITLLGGWWFMSFFVLRPVRSLSRASEAMASGRLDTRVAPGGRDELAGLGHRFDVMASNLQQTMGRLEEHQAFLQGLLDAIPDGVRVIGPDFVTVASNRAFRNQMGLEPDSDPKEPCYRVSHDRDEPCVPTLFTCPVHELRQHSEPIKCLHCHQRRDGGKFQVEVYAAPMTLSWHGRPTQMVVESIRDLERQVQYSQEQKLADLGQLAAGVAHEIRNPLSSIHLALQSLLANGDDRQHVERYLKLVDTEIDKCIQVNERLLALSAGPSSAPQLVALNTAVEETLSLLNFESENRGVELQLELDPCGPRVIATDGELRQIVLNLVQNAFHALPEGGRVRVSTGCDGSQVMLRVEDNGRGIAAQDRPRIFQPFFSRRPDGVTGTGLGLAITRSLVSRHHGTIEVSSEHGAGTTFAVRLPNPDHLGDADNG